jgi:hypothetical protein
VGSSPIGHPKEFLRKSSVYKTALRFYPVPFLLCHSQLENDMLRRFAIFVRSSARAVVAGFASRAGSMPRSALCLLT